MEVRSGRPERNRGGRATVPAVEMKAAVGALHGGESDEKRGGKGKGGLGMCGDMVHLAKDSSETKIGDGGLATGVGEEGGFGELLRPTEKSSGGKVTRASEHAMTWLARLIKPGRGEVAIEGMAGAGREHTTGREGSGGGGSVCGKHGGML